MTPETEEAPKGFLTSEKEFKSWSSEIADALKREKAYREKGKKCVDLYEAKAPEDVPFAILYSNTETLIPALYNARPIPLVTRRFKDADPVGKAVAETSTRMLKFLIEASSADYDTFDELMQSAVLDGVVTNRGLTRFKYAPMQGSECVYGEAVRWDKFLHGYARTWKKVPWVSFEWDMSKEEMEKNFKDVAWDAQAFGGEDDGDKNGETREELTGVKTFKVYEVWDKIDRTVLFFSPCYKKGLLRKVEDPLTLKSFFPVPKPLNFMRKITTLVPTPLYEHYKQQANELNEVTRRLKAIIRAIKYRGGYNASVDGIEKILKADDNELVPIENVASMGDNPDMDKLLWTVPVEKLAATAQSLYQQREAIKTVIYEITGISDILRGSSQASETATAQNIKNQWGTLRLKKMQKEVQRYCRDALEIMLEIAVTSFDIQTVKAMTGLLFPEAAEKQQFQAQTQQMAQMAQQAQQPPPEVPPEVQQMMSLPAWEEIQQAMSDDVTRGYKTDIETNSTIDAEAAQDKQDISELLNALSQFLNGLAPLVEQGIMPFDVAKSMLLVIARRYNFGSQLEDSLNSLNAPKPAEEKPDPEAMAKAEALKQDGMMKQQDAALKQQESQQKFAMMQAEGQQKQVVQEQEMAMKAQELEMKRAEMEAQAAMGQRKLENDITIAQIKAQSDFRIAQMKARMDMEAEKFKAELSGSIEREKAQIAAESSVQVASMAPKPAEKQPRA